MNTGIIIQARMGSKRFPNKVLKKIKNKPLIKILLLRLSKIKIPNLKIIVATSTSKNDNEIYDFCKNNKVNVFRGPLFNVAERYLKCANKFNIDNIIRITGDCPLIDPKLVETALFEFLSKEIDYLSTTCPPEKRTYPDGMDIEIFRKKSLQNFLKTKPSKEYKEHVTFQYWKEGFYKKILMTSIEDFSKFRLTVDYKEDFEVIKSIINAKGFHASLEEIINFLKENESIFKLNSMYYFGQGWEQ